MASLYLHIPFCEHKCIYCDFYSIAPRDAGNDDSAPMSRFVDALEKEIDLCSGGPFAGSEFSTIFFGGGTPSLLALQDVAGIFSRIRKAFRVLPDAEITMEVNPGTVDRWKLDGLRELGVNRLSVGIQSFDDADLRLLTRIHTADQARQCIRDARDAGFENISLDLIFSLPGQTREKWKRNLEEALSLEPQHLSCYSLIVEPHTPLFRMVQSKEIQPTDAGTDAELYEETIDFLGSHGYRQYEVSNFTRPGFECRHNCRYWDHSDYLGLGPSAHSFQQDTRWWNIANLQAYSDALGRNELPRAGREQLTRVQLAEEEIFLGLRSTGIDCERLAIKYGMDLRAERNADLERLISNGLATLERNRLALTRRGYPLCDEICRTLL